VLVTAFEAAIEGFADHQRAIRVATVGSRSEEPWVEAVNPPLAEEPLVAAEVKTGRRNELDRMLAQLFGKLRQGHLFERLEVFTVDRYYDTRTNLLTGR
jgi:hypothetical protein